MEIVERDEIVVIGIEVVANFGQLHSAVPAAWHELFSRQDELPGTGTGVFVEASTHLGEGSYREVIGVVAVGAEVTVPATVPVTVPEGMAVAIIPGGKFVHHRHDGSEATIATGFQAIYDWAADQQLTLGNHKLDVGYTDDGGQHPHELYVDVIRRGRLFGGDDGNRTRAISLEN